MVAKSNAAKKKAAPKKKAVPKAEKPQEGGGAHHPLMVNGKDWDREKVMDAVCNAIATSSRGLGSILKAGHDGKDLPSYSTVMKWLDEDAKLSDRYARAKEAQADFLAEEFIDLHEKAWVPALVEGVPLVLDGKPIMIVDKSSAMAVRLEAENKKWLMGKLKPKKYGDKVQQEVTGAGGGPIETKVTYTAEEAYLIAIQGKK